MAVVLQASTPSSAESDDEVIVSQVGDKGVFTMNRPKVLNALNVSMIRRMTAQLKVNFICRNKPPYMLACKSKNFEQILAGKVCRAS